MERNSIKKLLMTSNFFVLNKQLVKNLGIETAFFLTTLVEADDMLADEDGWFYQTVPALEEITGLSNHKQSKCIEQLISLDILSQENKGMPMKRYFKLNYDQVLKFLNTRIEKNSNQDLKNIESKDSKNLKPCFQKISNNKELNINNLDKELNIKTTTKLDNLDKIDQESKDTSSDSSSLVEKSSSDEKERIYQIKSALQSHGLSIETCKNIMELVRNGRVDLDRIKSVLTVAPMKAWGEGAIYKALRDNWDTGEVKQEKNLTEEDVENFLKKRVNHWLDAYNSIGDYNYASNHLLGDISKYAGDFPDLVESYYAKFENLTKKGA